MQYKECTNYWSVEPMRIPGIPTPYQGLLTLISSKQIFPHPFPIYENNCEFYSLLLCASLLIWFHAKNKVLIMSFAFIISPKLIHPLSSYKSFSFPLLVYHFCYFFEKSHYFLQLHLTSFSFHRMSGKTSILVN